MCGVPKTYMGAHTSQACLAFFDNGNINIAMILITLSLCNNKMFKPSQYINDVLLTKKKNT
jgi:hypothetical protein